MNFLIALLYEIAIGLLALIALPKFLYDFFVHHKYQTNILSRLGIRYPEIKKGSQNLVWIHACSVGETKAIIPLARILKQTYPQTILVISSITETGHAEAQRSLPFADYHVYLPFDFRWIVNRIMKKVKPTLVILSESDFWLNFLKSAKQAKAGLALVNGKISERSMNRFQKVEFFAKPLFGLFDLLCVQNEIYRERFLKSGAEKEKIVVTGNLKFDDEHPQLSMEEVIQWRQKLGIDPSQLVLTIGSTHDPEEEMMLTILQEIWEQYPSLKVILVPRHPERFKEVANLLEREAINFITFTDISQRTGHEQIILIDAMGMLRMCYQLSDLAIVGGSFTSKVGGHNILEPCWYGKPVLFGPYMHAQPELVTVIKEGNAGVQVGESDLKKTIFLYLADSNKRKEVGINGLHLVDVLKGSTKRTLTALQPLLKRLK